MCVYPTTVTRSRNVYTSSTNPKSLIISQSNIQLYGDLIPSAQMYST